MNFGELLLTQVRFWWLSFVIAWYESEAEYLAREIAKHQRILDDP